MILPRPLRRSRGYSRISLSDRVQRLLVRVLARLPGSVQVRLSGRPPTVVDGQALDPQLQFVISVRRRRNPYGYVEPTVEEGRARLRHETAVFGVPRTAVGSVRDFTISGDGGPLRVRHYAPLAGDKRPRPLTVFLHGGGFAVGDLDTHDEPCRLLCRNGDTHVLSVDYRLAPEHPFPAALDDTLTALQWAQANAGSLGADPTRVALGGDSAGGNLTAVASRLAARERRPPVAQLLIYPATDSETPRPSQALFGHGYLLDQRDREAFSGLYLCGTGLSGTDPRVSPLLAEDLGELPPALVVIAGFDILRDEGDAYAEALRAAGTSVRTIREPGLSHAFLNMTAVVPAAHRATVAIGEAWRAMLAELER
jgi:acetyl esterase